jgi:hypothetical protein
MTATSQAPSSGSAGESGGMEELLPLVLQLTNPEQVRKCPLSTQKHFFGRKRYCTTCACMYCIQTSA